MIWIPTAAGEAAYRELADGARERPSFQPLKTPAG
jgi:hypothetical protein